MLGTKLQRIALRSAGDPCAKFDKLMSLFSKDNLRQCFHELKEGRATGIDRKSKSDYGQELDNNLDALITRMKALQYRPKPVREVLISKDDGGLRPLGISVIEDKIVQLMYQKILEAIYEPHFLDGSYGFRPRRNCHQAIQKVHNYLSRNLTPVVIDADVSNYFGTIDHRILLDMLSDRISDKTFLRYLARMLKAGIMSEEGFHRTDEGSPQGAICSPVLSNIYAHFALDLWMEQVVKPRVLGVQLIRYADDFVICCPNLESAKRIREALGKRLERFALCLHPEKTRIANLTKATPSRTNRPDTFSFLGFTFYIGKSRRGSRIPKLKTDSKKFRAKQKQIKIWLKARRSSDFNDTWQILNRKLEGHARYYGVTFNIPHVERFLDESRKQFFKWMNRRSQKRSMDWAKFRCYMKLYPPLKSKVYFPLFPKLLQAANHPIVRPVR